MFFLINRTEFTFKPFHDKVIQKLQDIADCKNVKKNLLLNLPVGAGKSILTEFFITWTFARNPSIKHLYVSHSELLITKLSRETLELIESPYWQSLFGHELDQKSSTQYNFIDAGTRSGMTAAPIGSALTGIDCSNPAIRGFSGALCFSYNTPIWTDRGILKIGDIVTKRLPVKVWSYNTKTKEFSFKPITHYHDNGISKTIEFCGIRCTPSHRFMTQDGWKEAKDILTKDVLFGFSYPFYLIKSYAKFFTDIFSFVSCVKNKIKIFIRKTFVFPLIINYRVVLKMFKRLSFFYRNNCSNINFVGFSNFAYPSFVCKNRDDLFVSQISMTSTQTSTFNSVLHIVGFSSVSQVIKPIVRRIVIKMSGFNTFFLNTYKCPKNKLMNSNRLTYSIMRTFKKINILITPIVYRFKNFFRTSVFKTIFSYYYSFKTFYSTKVRNLVKSLVIRDVSPYFNHKSTSYENVYCLSIQDNHTFFVGGCQVGLLSHNCIDDPIDISNANSEVMLNEVIRLYTDKLKTRLRTKTAPIILIMQRVSTNDLAQYVMDAESEDWDVVIVKAYNEETKTSFWPEKYPVEMLEKIKIRTPELYYSQYQQEPRATGGSLFTRDMFRIDALPEFFDFTAIMADTAYRGTERNDWTVFAAIGKANGRMYILDVKRARINSDKIEEYFLPFISKYATREDFMGCYIEPKGHGIYLNQRLPQLGVPIQSETIIKDFYKDRKRDKVIRANVIIPDVANYGITFNSEMDRGLIEDCIQEAIEFPDGKHDDVCLVGDTLISTIRGKIPIKEIKKGDLLITPLGLSKVKDCRKTGYKEVVKKYGIEATENHKIFDKKLDKFVEIKYDVCVDRLTYGDLIKWSYKRLLYLMERSMLLWGRKGIISIHQQQIKGESVLKDFIKQFGNFIQERKFLKGMLFIIKTAILLITTTLIWSVYQGKNILKSTINLVQNFIKDPNKSNILKRLESLQKSGTEVKKEESGTENTQNRLLNQSQKLSSAQIVEENLEKSTQTSQTNTETQYVENVMINIIREKKDVYNITTTAGCYYANNILVSNCDCIVDGAKLVYKHIPSILEVI